MSRRSSKIRQNVEKIIFLIFFPLFLFGQKAITKIPFKNDYRSGELTYQEFDDFLKTKPVHIVIRLNGQSSDSFGLGIEEERKLCQKHGIVFKYLPMRKPYEKWAQDVGRILNMNSCLVHCKWGHDRTGFVVGYNLIKYHKKTFEWIRKYNEWNKNDRYSKKFYPILRKL